jgi:hypothetical protein
MALLASAGGPRRKTEMTGEFEVTVRVDDRTVLARWEKHIPVSVDGPAIPAFFRWFLIDGPRSARIRAQAWDGDRDQARWATILEPHVRRTLVEHMW